MATWHDIESARDEWIDAPLNDDVLQQLLDVSQEAVIAYASKLRDDQGVVLDPLDPETVLPTSWRYAQLQQSRNVWNASRVDNDGQTGSGDFTYTPRPLDWHVRQLLRPNRGVPRVR